MMALQPLFIIGLLLMSCKDNIVADAHARALLNLEDGKRQTERLLSLIYNRYELFNSSSNGLYLLRPFLNIDLHTWDMLKYKYALKMLLHEDFLFIFGGSSVTAGHDNYLNESYPQVYERRMKGPLQALGINLKVCDVRLYLPCP